MDKEQVYISDFFAKSEANYHMSIRAIIRFIEEFLYELSRKNVPRQQQIAAEKMIVMSLVLIEKIHMHIFCSHHLYKEVIDSPEGHKDLHKKEQLTLKSFRKLKYSLRNYHFRKEEYENLAKNIISQILTYYR